MARLRHLFLSLLFIEFMGTATIMLGYHAGLVQEFANNFHSKLSSLWRLKRLVDAPLTVPELIEDCMRTANLASPALVRPAIANAKYFYREFRKAIPEAPLTGYRSHCWVRNYSVQWDKPPSYKCKGELGNITFARDFTAFFPYQQIFSYMAGSYPQLSYNSSTVCLPNFFVAGFPKCGSTFLYYMVDSLISLSSKDLNRNQVEKDTQFWVHFDPFQKIKIGVPKVEDLGGYLFNFIPGIDKVSKKRSHDTVLVDGTPNYINEWPIFLEEENDITNYCLIPAVLPRLLPRSKYFVIMRNPIDMLYSNFWFSCTKNFINIPFPYKGPQIFHQRTVTKIAKFNICMKNESEERISFTCTMLDKKYYSSCIRKRIHLLDRCAAHTLPEIYSADLPQCGDIWLSVGLFYVHIRKWLHILPRERIIFLTLDEVNKNPSIVAHRILKFLDLNTTLANDVRNVNAMLWSGKVNTKQQNEVNYNGDIKLQMRKDTKQLLEIFYHPFNSLLVELLGDHKYQWF